MRPLLLAFALCLAPSAWADPGLYAAWGGKSGIRAVMDDFVARLPSDPRIGRFFKETALDNLAEQLTEQLCQLSGGPCRYQGGSMREVHEGMGVRRADFNALVELLQQAMAARGIGFADQNRMLALLAPMHRDIVAPR